LKKSRREMGLAQSGVNFGQPGVHCAKMGLRKSRCLSNAPIFEML
jgi:hypothetical protein